MSTAVQDNVTLFKKSLEVSRTDGKPPKYTDVNTLINRINEYFEYCHESELKITLTGLAMFLGFSSRQSIYDYAKIVEGKKSKTSKFSYIVKKALIFIEQDYEQSMRKSGRTTDIFALKNFGWSDESTTTIKGDPNNPIGLIAMPAKKEALEWSEDRQEKIVSNGKET